MIWFFCTWRNLFQKKKDLLDQGTNCSLQLVILTPITVHVTTAGYWSSILLTGLLGKQVWSHFHAPRRKLRMFVLFVLVPIKPNSYLGIKKYWVIISHGCSVTRRPLWLNGSVCESSLRIKVRFGSSWVQVQLMVATTSAVCGKDFQQPADDRVFLWVTTQFLEIFLITV